MNTATAGDGDSIRACSQALRRSGLLDGWQVHEPVSSAGAEVLSGAAEYWCHFEPPGAARREAGFKIHVSATLGCAAAVLDAVAPLLAARRVAFKHAASTRYLAFLSSGGGGVAQIGKFITVYPQDADEERELALHLHTATRHLRGPAIAAETAVAPGSLVHFRYGGFAPRWLQLRSGQIVAARLGPQGLEPDPRGSGSALPAGVLPPLAGHEASAEGEATLLRGRYLRVQRLHVGPKGATWLGFDLAADTQALLVIKLAWAHVMEGSDGLDACARLHREAQALRALAPSGVTPEPLDFWQETTQAVLVYRMVEGPTLTTVLASLAAQALRPPVTVLRQWLAALCVAVGRVHRLGHVVGDLKPANLVWVDGQFRLIDLELAAPPSDLPCGTMGTRGYASPQQLDAGAGRALQDDIHAIGATLLAAATLTDVAVLPDARAVAALESRRHHGDVLYETIHQCLAADAAARPVSTDAILARLQEAADKPCAATPPATPHADATPPNWLAAACAVGDALLRDARRSDGGLHWLSSHPTTAGQPARDLYVGAAGSALFLCALYEATGEAPYLEAASACASGLWASAPAVPRQAPMPGLYFGDSGCGLLYLALARACNDERWLARALVVGEQVDAADCPSPDLMTGRAGRGLFQLALWQASGEPAALQRAWADAQALLASRRPRGAGWPMPADFDTLSGREYLGLAHGTAGIGWFLAECCIAQPDTALAAACLDLADGLVAAGRPVLADHSGLGWPAQPGDAAVHAAHWCHGATGIARFLLRAGDATGKARCHTAARRAGRTVALGPQWLGTTQCHGLASNLELLLDLGLALGDEDCLHQAAALGENLLACRTAAGWPSEHPAIVCPDLMVGQAGVGAAFLRLAAPDRPHLISPAAFTGHGLRHFKVSAARAATPAGH